MTKTGAITAAVIFVIAAAVLFFMVSSCDPGQEGSTGPAGETGRTGKAGPAGETGARGPEGPPGETGQTGQAGPAGETGPRGPEGPPGPARPPGDAADLSDEVIWPELRIDVTISTRCAERILDTYEFEGTTTAIERQKRSLEYLLAQPARYMADWHIDRIRDWMGRTDSVQRACEDDREALQLFYRARDNNPMGNSRADGLQAYWYCAYPDDDLLGGDYGGDLWNDSEDCSTVEQWIPPSWIPPEERP